MSVDEYATERAALERKDREELQQIAGALGGKVNSRTRKADMIQQILELTGMVSAPPPSTEAAEGDRGDSGRNGDVNGRSDGATAAAAQDAAERLSPDDAAEGLSAADAGVVTVGTPAEAAVQETLLGGDTASIDAATSGGGEGGASTEVATAVEEVTGADEAAGEPPAAAATEASPEDVGQAGQAAAEQAEQAPTERSRRDGPREPRDGQQQRAEPRDRQQQRDGQQQDGQPRSDDDGELGNRRRRRRGRNRDGRDGRDAPGQGQGGGQGGQGGQALGGPHPQGQGTGGDDWSGEPVEVAGHLDLRDDGYGFLRVKGYLPSKQDVYVSVKQARQFGLRKGDHLVGASRPAMRNEKNPALLRIDLVNGKDPELARNRRNFDDLTALFPDEKLKLEVAGDPTNMTARIIDLISPIGKGQRGLIVSPPKAGKTTVMKQIAQSIERNSPEVHLMVLLVDERPEEVTDMRRSVKTAEVVSSTFDRPSDEHTHVAELAIARAQRLVEEGRDVVIILDGITRLARAYNMSGPASGRLMSGGIDSAALYPPKRFFGAARNLEEGGSLTILATALVETGSKMDEVIFEEFKGTGNMELRLDRRMAERRIYPAIDVDASSTRHEELLFARNQLNQVWKLRRVLSGLANSGEGGNSGAGLELLIDRMKTFQSNDEFLAEVAKAPSM